MKPTIAQLREDNDGVLPTYAWPGGYVIAYHANDDGVYCADCANDPDAGPFEITGYDILEGAPGVDFDYLEPCDECGRDLDPAARPTARAPWRNEPQAIESLSPEAAAIVRAHPADDLPRR